MAHLKMWYQGAGEYKVPKCDGKPDFVCPQSRRVAAEYLRGYFTLTNVLNPNLEVDNLGYETWLFKELETVAVGDYLWMVLVPPKHHVQDVFTYNEATMTELSSLTTMAGITLTLVTGKFKEADAAGNCEMTDEVEHGSLVMPAGADAKEQFLRAATDITNDPETWTGVGVRVDALPSGKTLADIIGKIVVGAHVLDYDAQTFM